MTSLYSANVIVGIIYPLHRKCKYYFYENLIRRLFSYSYLINQTSWQFIISVLLITITIDLFSHGFQIERIFWKMIFRDDKMGERVHYDVCTTLHLHVKSQTISLNLSLKFGLQCHRIQVWNLHCRWHVPGKWFLHYIFVCTSLNLFEFIQFKN